MVVREATTGDATALAPLLSELGYPSAPDQVRARLARLGADPASRVFVAESEDGELTGMVATHLFPRMDDDEFACRLIAMIVAERHRRTGVGRALMEAVEAEARQQGAGLVALSSGHDRADAHAFYEDVGFVHRGRSYGRRLD